tara:strand:+ start:2374 stop:3402 length:1029 start_codon:yes stop_codon:yes gene_type:complete
VQKLLNTDWLFLLLLTGSVVGHMAIGGLGDSQTEVVLGSIQQGESSIAIQLLAATRPPEESFLAEQEYTEQDSAIDRREPENLKQLDPKLKQQETPVIDSNLIRQQAEQFEEVVSDGLRQRVAEYHSYELPVAKVAPFTNRENSLSGREIQLQVKVSETPPVEVEAIIANDVILNRQPEKSIIQRLDSSSTKEQEQLNLKSLRRDRLVVELDLEGIIADAPPRKGNSDSDVIVQSRNGANTAPSLDPQNALNRPPVFPQELVSKGISGTVKMEVTVQPDGKVKSSRIVLSTGSKELDQLAQEAVTKWQFEPGLTNGQAATKRVIVPITFKIEKRRVGVLKRQ